MYFPHFIVFFKKLQLRIITIATIKEFMRRLRLGLFFSVFLPRRSAALRMSQEGKRSTGRAGRTMSQAEQLFL